FARCRRGLLAGDAAARVAEGASAARGAAHRTRPRRRHGTADRFQQRGRGRDRLRDPERAGAGGGMPRAGPCDPGGWASGRARVRPAAAGSHPFRLSLVREAHPPGGGTRRVTACLRICLSAGVGEPVPSAGRVRAIAADDRVSPRRDQAAHLRYRLPVCRLALRGAGPGGAGGDGRVGWYNFSAPPNLLMYFDFEDGHPEIPRVPSALTLREGVLLSIIVHLLAI